MHTHVQQAYSETSLLAFPNVRVHIRVEPWPTVISEDGHKEGFPRMFPRDIGSIERAKLDAILIRNWREIRTNLLNLDMDRPDSLCSWLGSAGYVPEAMLECPNALYYTPGDVERMAASNLGWRPKFVTDGIRRWLKMHRDVFAWLRRLNENQFREAIKAAHEYRTAQYETDQTRVNAILSEKPRTLLLKDPAKTFLETLGAPNLDASVLGLALRGTSESERLAAYLYWDKEGFPTVTARCDSPIEALCLSIHIDQNFSQRRAVNCARCGKWLDQIRGRDRFCSKECRNFYTTAERRKKIGLVKRAAQDWTTLPAQKKANRDRAEWIVSQVNKQTADEYALEVSWVRKMLGSSELKSQRTRAQNKPVPGAKTVTRRGRAAKRAERE